MVLAFLKLLIARNIFIGILVVINPKNLTRYRMDGLGDCPGTHRQNGMGLGHNINIIAAVLPLFGKTGVFQVAGGVSLTVKVIGVVSRLVKGAVTVVHHIHCHMIFPLQ